MGLEEGFLSSTTCWFYTRLTSFAPNVSPVDLHSFSLLHLIISKAQYKAGRTIQAETAGLQRQKKVGTEPLASGLGRRETPRGGIDATAPVQGSTSAPRGPAPRNATGGHVTAARVPGRCGLRGRRGKTASRPRLWLERWESGRGSRGEGSKSASPTS